MGSECAISSTEYRDLYTIFAFDCSDQQYKSSTKTTNLKVEIKRKEVARTNEYPTYPRMLKCYLIVLDEANYAIDVIGSKITEVQPLIN